MSLLELLTQMQGQPWGERTRPVKHSPRHLKMGFKPYGDGGDEGDPEPMLLHNDAHQTLGTGCYRAFGPSDLD